MTPLSRSEFCRRLALTAAGSAIAGPLWAAQSAPAKPTTPRKFETKVLWEFEGGWDHPRMKRIQPIVHNGQLYAVIWLPELQTHVSKVSLAGGKGQVLPLMPGHVTGEDPHRGYRVAADSTGRIHISGDMHGSAFVKHWLSRKPEEIDGFDFACGAGSNLGPAGAEVTYPAYFKSPDGVLYHSIRCGIPAMGVAISVLDAKAQTWSIVGASIAREELEGQRRHLAAKTNANPLSFWEDNGEGGSYGYMQPHAKLVWDRNKRLHFVCSVLNKNTPTANMRHSHTHVLYAYSDDGGKTVHRGDGTEVKWPIRADEGPHQGDVVFAETDGNPPWLSVSAGLRIDEQNRPVVSCLSHKTGPHSKVLQAGKWIPAEKPDLRTATEEEDDDLGDEDLSDFNLSPTERRTVAIEYFRATGEAVYISFPDENRRRDKGYTRLRFMLKKPAK